MNRVSRRQQARGAKERTYTYTESQFKKIISEEEARIKKELVAETTEVIVSVVYQSIHDVLGIGKKRMKILDDRIQNKMNCVHEGYTSVEELSKWRNDFLKGA